MKYKRALIILVLALLFGMAAAMTAFRLQLGPGGATRRVVVAAVDINRGQRLGIEMLREVEWPAQSVPAGVFNDKQVLADRVLKLNVMRGDPISDAKLAPVGTQGGLSALIEPGKRAITVRVNDVIGVAGFALPGNYVDVIVHTEREGDEPHATAKGRHVSKIVLERILVLAVAQEINRDDTKPRVVNAVTLEVSPQQAETLDLARGVGTLSLALRNQNDQQHPNTGGATKLSLLGAESVPVPARPAPRPGPRRAPPGPAPQAAPKLPLPTRICAGVINGVHITQECF